jgi:L-malate glycosyltransferase
MNRSVLIGIPVLLCGGTEIQTLNLARTLVESGHIVTACCYYQYDPGIVAAFQEAGTKVVLLEAQPQRGLFSLLKRLVAFISRTRPDIVHVQYMAPGFIPVLAARLAGVRTVFAVVHQPGRPYGRKEKLLLRTAARLCTAFFCNSRAVEESWFGDSSLFDPASARTRHHWTIYNAVDVEKITAITAAADVPTLRSEFGVGAGPVIGCVGRLRHEKGQAILVDAMAEVVKTFATARLLVVGDGPDANTLKYQTAQKGLQNHVIWCGKTDAERVFQLYSLMDVVAVPSHFEGFGLVAAEAMAAGRAVVASAVDGLAEVVENGVTGILVQPGDSTALAEALIDLFRHPGKAIGMGRNGKERVRNFFSIERYRDCILAAYVHCVDPKHVGGHG